MNDKKFIIIIAVLTLAILFGGIVLISKSTSIFSVQSSPKISLSEKARAETQDPTSFDWGIIPMKGGYAVKTFAIKNIGTDTLKFYNIKTSCHCTKARMTIDGKDSPDFGMSDTSDWVGELAPGKIAKLTAIFDPAFHGPQGVGPINRFVSVETNDKGTPKITFTLTGTVVK